MHVKYVLKLSSEERERLERITKTGQTAAWKIQRAQALLKMDRGKSEASWTDTKIAEAFGMSTRSLESWRKQAVEKGPESLLTRRRILRPWARKLDGEGEAQLVRLACSSAPEGRVGWTLELLANRLVTLQIVERISRETVRRTLKKTISNPG